MKFITVQGPTASGKTTVAIALAKKLNSEIISADSRQIYRYMDIGTAKPSKMEQVSVRHHLIDVVNPDESYSAGRFADDAAIIVKSLNEQGKIPVIAGGTGFYIKALQNGLFESPDVDSSLREGLMKDAQESPAKIFRRLEEVDPESANRIHPNDIKRVVRALEVYEQTGEPMSVHWERQRQEKSCQNYNILLNPVRETLYARINERLDRMMVGGFLEEAKKLLDMGYGADDPGMNAVGYRELVDYLQNGGDLSNAIELAKQKSRNYAKRQVTWYRRGEFDLTLRNADINISAVIREIENKLGI